MSTHTIKRGFDIPLAGAPERRLSNAPEPAVVAVEPPEFTGVRAKVVVEEGQAVRTGEPLFLSKKEREILWLSPATGTVKEVLLGERRAPQRITVELTGNESFAELPSFAASALGSASRDDIVSALKTGGLWPLIRQRPIGRMVRDAARVPVAIFVNGMDTAPLAADPAFAVRGHGEDLQFGLDALARLTGGDVHLCVRAGAELPAEFRDVRGALWHEFAGPHPAGTAGTHISRIRPLRSDEVAWTLRADDVVRIGSLLRTGRYPAHLTVAVGGSAAPQQQYFRVRQGAPAASLTGGRALGDELRVIRGTVLGGEAVGGGGFIGYAPHTITVIPEGEGRRDLLGWALPQPNKLSASRAVWSWLKPKPAYEVDARVHGGRRAIVNIGAWESVLALDIHPTFLVRAIQANDLDEAIQLGLLEVTEEDVALCTFVDPCKIEVDKIVREGLDLYESES